MKYSQVYEFRRSPYSLWHRCCLQETAVVGSRRLLQGEATVYQGTRHHIPEGRVRWFQCLVCNHTFRRETWFSCCAVQHFKWKYSMGNSGTWEHRQLLY